MSFTGNNMKRKLVRQGVSTMMISLPTRWIKENKLDKGDEVEVLEERKSLIINANQKKEINLGVFDVTGFSPLINRILISKYIKGFDEIEVRFSNPEEIKDFQKRVINELIGFEVIKQTQKSILIKDITGTGTQGIEDIMKRVFFILDSMAEELIVALEKKQNTDAVIETDMAVNKFVHFCLRMLNKNNYPNTKETYAIVSLLEDIGDGLKRIAKDSKKIKITQEYLEIIKSLRQQLVSFKEVLFSYKKENLINYAKNYEKIKENIKKIKNKTLIDFHLFQINETLISLNNYFLAMSDVGVVA